MNNQYPSLLKSELGLNLQALRLVGLLSGSRSKYVSLLILDKHSVLSDLPVTLCSLLAGPAWEDIAEPVASSLLASTERIYDWATDATVLLRQPIDETEREMAGFMLHVLYRTSLSLKDYLPLEKQLKLADMAAVLSGRI